MAENIDDLVSAKAFADLERLNALLKEGVSNIMSINKQGVLLESALGSTKGVKETSDKIKELAKNTKLLESTIVEVEQVQVKATEATIAYTNAINKQQTAELKAQQEATKWASTQTQNNNERKKQTQAEITSISTLTAEIKALRAERDKLDVTTIKGQLRIKELNEAIKQNSRIILQNQDVVKQQSANVGNYPKVISVAEESLKKFGNTFGKVWSGIRTAANVLPGLGISGIFLLAFEAISPLIEKIYALIAGTKELAKAQESVSKAFESSDYKKAVHDVNELKINVQLAKEGFLSKDEVLKEYNKTLGSTLGYVTSLDEAEKMLVKNGDAYIKMTLYKAAANYALDQAAAKYVNAEKTRQEKMKQLEGRDPDKGQYKGFFGDLKDLANDRGLGVDAVANEVEGIKKEGDDFTEVAKKFQEDAAVIAKSLGVSVFGNDKPGTTKSSNKNNIGKGTKKDRKQEIEDYKHDLYQLDQDIQQMNEKTDKETIERVQKRLEKIKRLNAQYAKDELDLIKENLEAQQRDWDNYDKEREDALRKQLALYNQLGDIAQAVTGAISAVSDILYQKEISQIDERDKKLEDSYDQEKKQIESKYLTQAQKEKELAQLESRREQERKAIERERVAAARRNAQRQKQLDVANIITTTALAIMGALSRVKTDGPTAYAQAIAVGITGATQLARAIAAPLPQYKDGTLDHKGGFAVVGDGGVSELVVEPDGTAYLTPSKSTVVDLPKHSQVFNPEQMMQGVYNLAYKQLGNGQKVTTDKMQVAMLESFNKLADEMKGVKKEIRNIKLGVNLHGDMEHFLTMKNIIS